MRKSIKKIISAVRADRHLWEVMSKASSSLMIQILGSIFGFAASVAIARMLGAEGSGVYYLAMSVATIAAVFGRVGFDNTVVRFIASHASAEEWGSARFVYRTAMQVVAAASLVITLILFLSADWMADVLFNKPYMVFPLQLVSVAVLPLSLAMIQAEGLRGLRKIPASQWIKNVSTSLGTILLLYPLVQRMGANGAVAAYVIAVVITTLSAWLLWRIAWRSRVSGAVIGLSGISYKPLFRSSWPLYGAALTGLVILQAATIFVGVYGTAMEVGVFVAANRVASLLLFPLMAMISILTPKFAEIYRQGNMDGLRQLACKSSQLLAIMSISTGIVVGSGAEWIMSLFGPDFKGGAIVLIILLAGVIVNSSTGAVAELLMMTGNEKDVKWIYFFGALILVILCPAMLHFWNLLGISFAVSLTNMLINLALLVQIKRRLDFWAVAMPNFRTKSISLR